MTIDLNPAAMATPRIDFNKTGSDTHIPAPAPNTKTLHINPRVVGLLSLALATAWTGIHCGFQVLRYGFGMDHVMGIARFFDLWTEQSIPTWYASCTLLACAMLLSVIGWGSANATRGDRYAWYGLSALFLFVSMDESIGIHESLIVPLRNRWNTHGVFFFAWVIPYSLALAIIAFVYARFFWQLPPATRRLFLVSAVIYLSGALGMEMIGGIVYEAGNRARALPIDLCNTIEESLEMLGVATFLYALTGHLANHCPHVCVRFGYPSR